MIVISMMSRLRELYACPLRENRGERRESVVVPVTVVLGVPVALVDVVHVIVVRNGDMAAGRAVPVVVPVVYRVLRLHAFVHMVTVRTVQVIVVRVVDVVLVRHRDVSASRGVLMGVGGVGAVFCRGGHLRCSSRVKDSGMCSRRPKGA